MFATLFRFLFLFQFFLCAANCFSQPFFDAAGFSMWRIPARESKNMASETEANIFIAAPIRLDSQNVLVIMPYYETKFLDDSELPASVRLQHTSLVISWRTQSTDSAWSFTIAGIGRSMSTQFRFNGAVFQYAGAVIVARRVRPNLIIKGGLYYSREFFGDFVVFLAGLEWKVNDRFNIFGLVNNSLKMEYKFNKRFYGGVVTKNISNSFRVNGDGGYYKLFDNHACLFGDVRFGKYLVWSTEVGHTAVRYMKSRNGAGFPPQDKDGFIFKTGFYLRMRFDE